MTDPEQNTGASLRDRAAQSNPQAVSSKASIPSACTCHSDDRPVGPCPQMFAASDCHASATVRDLRLALDWALEILIQFEPGDSRGVSSEFVAAEAIRAGYTNAACLEILAQAMEARRAETGTGSVHDSAVRKDAPDTGGGHG